MLERRAHTKGGITSWRWAGMLRIYGKRRACGGAPNSTESATVGGIMGDSHGTGGRE